MVDDHTKQLLDVCRLIASQRDIETLMTEVMTKCREIVPADRYSLWVSGKKPGTLTTMVGQGLDDALEISLKQPSLVGDCMLDQQEICVEDAYAPGVNFNRAVDKAMGYHTRSVLCIPILSYPPSSAPQKLGILQVINREDAAGKRVHLRCERRYIKVGSFTQRDRMLLREVAGFIAGALERVELLAQREQSLRDSRHAERSLCLLLARIIDLRDSTTGRHTWSVTSIALVIASLLELPTHMLRIVEMASTVHDLGKLLVPDDVLNHPGKLSSAMRAEIDLHPVHGRRLMLDGLSWPPNFIRAAEVAFKHHEKRNGTGYPDCLGKEHIPWETQIISAADVYDALTADRPYRAKIEPREALRMCEEMTPHHLEETAVAALREALEECDYDLDALRERGWKIRESLKH